jgi:hypothetical protein
MRSGGGRCCWPVCSASQHSCTRSGGAPCGSLAATGAAGKRAAPAKVTLSAAPALAAVSALGKDAENA